MPSRFPSSPTRPPQDPSLRTRCSSRPSSVLRPPRTSAARRSTSPSAYTSRLVATTTSQSDLPCSAPLLQPVLRPLPRRDRVLVLLRTAEHAVLPSPGHERLGSLSLNLSRLQASLDFAARVVAPSKEAFDVQLQQHPSLHALWTCYPALRRLPVWDSHPLEMCSLRPHFLAVASSRHGAP